MRTRASPHSFALGLRCAVIAGGVALAVSCGGEVVGVARPDHGGPSGADAGMGGQRGDGGASTGGLGTGGVATGGVATGGVAGAPVDAAIHAGGRSDEPDASFDCVDPEPPPPATIARDVLVRFSERYCAWQERCVPGSFPDREYCLMAMLCGRQVQVVPGLTEAWLEACGAALEVGPGCALDTVGPCELPVPKAGPGEPCHTMPCTRGHYCEWVTDGRCPVCTPHLLPGARCDGGGLCPPDQRCDPVTFTCGVALASGEPCTLPGQCVSGRCVDGECRSRLGEGAVCSAPDECANGFGCRSGTCVAMFAREGEPCDPTTSCVVGACEEGRCVATCRDGEVAPGRCVVDQDCPATERCDLPSARCVARARTDEACRPGYRDCLEDHYCDATGACQPLRALGAACSTGTQCERGECRNGVCTPKCACTLP